METASGVTHTYSYSYDTAGRLTDVTDNGVLLAHYSYDANGNRISLTLPNGIISGTYDAQDPMLSYGANTFTYAANGELQSKINSATNETTQYIFGNLTTVLLPTGNQITYVLDGENRRIGKKVNGIVVQEFLYQNDLNPISELDSTGAVVSRFAYGTKENVPDYLIRGGVTYRIISDHLGSPRLVINTINGSIVQRLDYDEFGNIISDTNPGFQPFGFGGGIYDRDTKLTRFGAERLQC